MPGRAGEVTRDAVADGAGDGLRECCGVARGESGTGASPVSRPGANAGAERCWKADCWPEPKDDDSADLNIELARYAVKRGVDLARRAGIASVVCWDEDADAAWAALEPLECSKTSSDGALADSSDVAASAGTGSALADSMASNVRLFRDRRLTRTMEPLASGAGAATGAGADATIGVGVIELDVELGSASACWRRVRVPRRRPDVDAGSVQTAGADGEIDSCVDESTTGTSDISFS